MIRALDTLWNAFSTRMTEINPQRKLGGYMDALDWPPKIVNFDTIYLLGVVDEPLEREGGSWAVPIYEHQVQFQWITRGTDVSTANNLEGRNRGDRSRTSWQIKEEMLKALYPGYAPKIDVTLNADQTLTKTQLNEPVVWTRPQFRIRSDKESGLVYGIALVRIVNMTEEIES